ncbi:alpha/beta hydrolase family protein [Viscerimonas tarda]
MKKITLCFALLLLCSAIRPMSSDERAAYLEWMKKNLIAVPEWTEWQQKTGELPPDFDQLPRTNLLPDPFRFFDGRQVNATPEGWKARRAEIWQLFEKYVTGTFPPKPPIDKVELIDETKGNGYTLRNVRVLFGPQSKGSVRIRLVIPDGVAGETFPALICPNLGGWAPSLVRRGYISAGYAGNDRMDDAEALKDIYPDYDFATLPRRAWLAQMVVDYLATTPQVNMKQIAIFGYSRDGKMASYAAALDERISALIAGSTGVGGAVPWRYAGERGGGEGIESTTRMFPGWFIPRFRYFSGKEDRLPVDANLLLSLVAPRAALLEWGLSDQVANGWAMEQACQSAQKVYEVLGQPTRLNLMHVPGFHGSNDQEACIDFLDIQFGRSTQKWTYDFVFPWNFADWRVLSGEKTDISNYPAYKALKPVASQSAWDAKAAQVRKSISWMLGDTPAAMPVSSLEMPMRGGAREIPGPTTIALGNTGNPGQLAPDVPAWVISGTSPEYGWLSPERNEVDSRRIRFGTDNVTGDFYFPKNLPEGAKLPTVIWLHGYHYPLGYMWVYRRDLHPILALVKAGYAVLAFDQTGFGMRTGESATFYGRYPHWSRMGKMVEDVSNSIDALQKEAIVDASNISLFGYTLGGTVGLYAAALDQRISGVVSVSGFTPMRTDTADKGTSGMSRYSHLYGLIPRLGFFAGNEQRLPYDFEDVISLIAPRPVLIVQPTMDREANPKEVKWAIEQAKAVYSLYKASDKLGLQEPDDYARLTTATQNNIIEWIQKNNKK